MVVSYLEKIWRGVSYVVREMEHKDQLSASTNLPIPPPCGPTFGDPRQSHVLSVAHTE